MCFYLAHLTSKTLPFKYQKGFVAILILVIVSLSAVGFIFDLMNSSSIKEVRLNQTGKALVQAKEALIGFSVGSDTMPGTLPCPDRTNDGVSDSCSASSSIGRLPWKTLGLSDLRDGDGECLWYALSPVYRNIITTAQRGTNISRPALNSTTAGSITVLNEQAVALPAPINKVIAVIIAPGSPLVGQSRANLGSTVCGGNITASNYLDLSNLFNNATGNRVGNNLSFIMGKVDGSFNDRLAYIMQEDLYAPLRKRISREMMGNFGVFKGVYAYYQNKAQYPCSASSAVTAAQDCATMSGYVGYIPYLDVDVKYTSLGAWLINNEWFGLTSYVYTTPTRVSLTVMGGTLTSSCAANAAVVTCN